MWDDATAIQEISDMAADCAEAAPLPVALPPMPGAVLFMKAGHNHCRWPLWEGEDETKFVCGSPRHSVSTSYCCEHWIVSGGARDNRAPSTRFLTREPKAVARERLDLLALQRQEGF